MKRYYLDVDNAAKKIYSGHIKLGGSNPQGERIDFTNYYMQRNKEPFFGICGEYHYSRYEESSWEDEIIKMKMCGVNIISTYIFWIHHEEVEGVFDWEENKNLRRFVELCGKHGLYVFIRIGPFNHGEVRNGGIPDWLFGQPFAIRSNDEGYLFYVRRFYDAIGKQVRGLLYKDGGAVIGTQIENEYMHAGAPWEITTGVSNEWLSSGGDGEDHMKKLKSMAREAGIETPVYTCTAWGGAAAPVDEMLPLWGGYAFWPWIFYDDDVKEHPATPEYLFRDHHNNKLSRCYNFEPGYKPEDYPYACCEMGGGMTVFYKYRFTVPPASVEAMTGIKVAGGCNFVGYYMFHGGSNPKGKRNGYLNEHATPKISYDFQAPLGEFGQVRESYKRLKLLHYFFIDFAQDLCRMKTMLPPEAAKLEPEEIETLRYALRVKNGSGFLFINNYQDHVETRWQTDFGFAFTMDGGQLKLPYSGGLSLARDSSCILPVNLNLAGITLRYASAQLITRLDFDGEAYYFFFTPEGMRTEYCFADENLADLSVENGVCKKTAGGTVVYVEEQTTALIKLTTNTGKKITLCTLTREQSLNLWKANFRGRGRILITEANVLATEDGLKLECVDRDRVSLMMFPPLQEEIAVTGGHCVTKDVSGLFAGYLIAVNRNPICFHINRVSDSKAVLTFAPDSFTGLKELLLRIGYEGDIGYAFIDGELIHDNFCNGTAWEIGLKRFEQNLLTKQMYISVSPLKKGSYVKNDSAMAARREVVAEETAVIHFVKAAGVYEIIIV
ncbi:Hypothetical protein LUCI_5153 [Lucifera butyrica]|uniref:Beta-galactosidase domain-containing protein n=1 Tax=Lucifera butyrica TaxID=1351585 RepID=A0A498RFR6_9FIRM|nr:beta-galactosidase [Lucifera butyrica]VBB09855.1 Hypothetical protein LUCI_5153 [Lucifera butyrica]